ncbi:hypothetical protein ACJX0J_036300, partial [Zea mays]
MISGYLLELESNASNAALSLRGEGAFGALVFHGSLKSEKKFLHGYRRKILTTHEHRKKILLTAYVIFVFLL